MSRLDDSVVDEIVRSCLSSFESLPKKGKPVVGEWTVLSCVVQLGGETDAADGASVVSLGTGSKCVGAGALSAGGDGGTLHDAHAEVCARRALLLYLYHHLERALASADSVFRRDGRRFRLKDDVRFAFYSSQLPCGDASILPKSPDEEVGDLLQTKRRATEEICPSAIKKTKSVADIHRTGAKCLAESEQDPKLPGAEYHVVGQVRTKPGRGERTLSVSCSDKMARWVHVGIQGALLDELCGPIYIKHFIFGNGVPYSEESLNRALLCRKCSNSLKMAITPQFYQSSIIFPYIKSKYNERPAPGSIIWAKCNGSSEVAVHGKKLGLTKKQASLPSHSLCISKHKLYLRFLKILQTNEELRTDIMNDEHVNLVPYNEMKRKCQKYNEKWQEVKEKFFGCWTVKPDMWSFCVNIL